jgi:hypothetical protein
MADEALTAKALAAVADASRQLDEAQLELRAALDELDQRQRADKTMISTLLREVLTKVSDAKRKLASLTPDDADD